MAAKKSSKKVPEGKKIVSAFDIADREGKHIKKSGKKSSKKARK